jgi:hypothetical protein
MLPDKMNFSRRTRTNLVGSKVRPPVQAIVIQHCILIDKYKFMEVVFVAVDSHGGREVRTFSVCFGIKGWQRSIDLVGGNVRLFRL